MGMLSLVPGLSSAGELQAAMNLRAVSFAKYPNWVAALSRSTCKPCRFPPKIMRRKREGQELGWGMPNTKIDTIFKLLY
jgi:hypothetical protein